MTLFRAKQCSQQGFTLMEVLVVMAITALLVPPILMLSGRIVGIAELGGSRNRISAHVRNLQQEVSNIVRGAEQTMVIADGGDSVLLNIYDESEETWTTAQMSYEEGWNKQRLIFYPDASKSDFRIISENIYPQYKEPFFSITNRYGVNFLLFQAQVAEAWGSKIRSRKGGHFVDAAVHVDLFLRPRNQH